MLKALEMAGFKSFADKTRFEFPDGITVVVGPNGSGKSNVVDAMKWVLGAQSAKALRGKDMSDVIFKGSGSGRKVMNSAEATIIFDNSSGLLRIDAKEVHVTRRVYRSGESEYLINGDPCRLRDIKDMFRGTGVGTDAYSLIEQGKVDRMLQASAKDRRAMFEEAAGISRFKAKKVEAQRRLDRVSQNLLRLSDIVDEVESRLKSVRSQASKARRYREYSQRLQELRTHVGMADWRRMTERLSGIETEVEEARQAVAEAQAESDSFEGRTTELEDALSAVDQAVRDGEQRASLNRERIATSESTIEHERSRVLELADEEQRHRANLVAMTGRAGDLEARMRETQAELAAAEQQHSAISQAVAGHERALSELTNQLDQLRSTTDQARTQYVTGMREVARLSNDVTGFESQLASSEETAKRCRQKLKELEEDHDVQRRQLESARRDEESLVEELASKAERLEAMELELSENRRVLARRQEEMADMQGRLRGATERAAIIEELENKREGLGEGVKEILALKESDRDRFSEVRGLVADLIHAPVETAALVDVALGDVARHIVLDGDFLIEELESGRIELSGRVGFVQLDAPARRVSQRIDLSRQEGVMGRLDRMVETDRRYSALVKRLLGGTWVVESLSKALGFNEAVSGRLRFVTLAGELVDGDTMVAGKRNSAIGIVSRRSELRALLDEIVDVERQIEQASAEVGRTRENIEQQSLKVRRLSDEHQQRTHSLSDVRVQVLTLEERFGQLDKNRRTLDSELRAAQAQHERADVDAKETRQRLANAEADVTRSEAAIRSDEKRLGEIDDLRQEHLRQATITKVDLAKSEEHVASLRTLFARFQDDRRERSHAVALSREDLAQTRRRQQHSERVILRITGELAELFLNKETLSDEIAGQHLRRDEIAQERKSLANQQKKVLKSLRKTEDRLHELEMSAGEIRHQRSTMAERLQEDYGIDISQLDGQSVDEDEREQVDDEIAELRRKINAIGAVNMDALAELDDLESRFERLSGQYHDLVQAKESLERIISKINADSRRLFVETLEAIRINFQTLYRKSFGGGHADLVLEEGVDVLEAGVDIVATPPGKPSFNNSLLSGGEKALTAVALLLAIFQFRPSPFCVLDEVDAPFDEANIGRFVDVLKSFLSWTKFVVVTHSKKTMTAATTLYGVTMQESGVSKQVSVQFDDVSEDGQISADAIERQKKQEDERAA